MPNKKKEVPAKRKFISLETKIKILDRLKNKMRIADVARDFKLNESSIRTIKQAEDKIRGSVASGSSILAKITARPRANIMEKMEQALAVWVKDMSAKRSALNKRIIKQKALQIFNCLKEIGQSSVDETSHKFRASNGWFEKFKKRHSFHNLTLQGATASADAAAANEYPLRLAKIIQEQGYLADQVFNADETGLWWKKMPSRTYISKVERTAPGFKAANQRITLLLCSNASGDFMTKPMCIYRSQNPTSMKNCNKNTLPVYWRANKKAWMTKDSFKDWFHHCFIPDVENYLSKKNLSFRVLLLLDNAASHSPDLSHPNVRIEFLPDNNTTLLQPQNQGIIATFKSYYIRKTFELIIEKMGSTESTVSEVWKQFSILNCIEIIGSALKELRKSTLSGCWKPLLPDMIRVGNDVCLHDEYSHIVNLAYLVEGDGFDEITIGDIQDLVNDDEINEAELIAQTKTLPSKSSSEDSSEEEIENFTLSGIEKGLDIAKQLERYFIENDPLAERAKIFKRNLQQCLFAYKEVYKDLQSKTKECLITDFLIPPNLIECVLESDTGSSPEFEKTPRKRSRPNQIISSDVD